MGSFLYVLGGLIFILMMVFITLAFYPFLADLTHTVRASATSESLSCTTTTLTTCDVALTEEHPHADVSHLTVTETSPGSTTRTATLDKDDRVTVSVAGLTAATAYTFTVAAEQVASNVSSELDDVLNLFPFVIPGIVMIVGFMFLAKMARREQ